MLEFENTIDIDRSIADVFAFLSDLENLPKWNYYVLNVKKSSDGPVGVGTKYHQVRKTDEQELCVTEFELNHILVVKSLPPWSPSLEMRFTLYAEGGGTRLQDEWTLDTGGPMLLNGLVGSAKNSGSGHGQSGKTQATSRRGPGGSAGRQASCALEL